MLANADHLLVSVLMRVLQALLEKMGRHTTPDIRAVLAVPSASSPGDVCSQQGWRPVSRSQQAQSAHMQVKRSVSKALSTTDLSNNPSLRLRAFWPILRLLPAGLMISARVALQKSKRLPAQRALRATSSGRTARGGTSPWHSWAMVS